MDTNNTAVQPEELARAQQGWANFTHYSQIGTVVVIAILALMALFLL